MSQTRAQLVKGFSNTSASDDAVTVDSSGKLGLGTTSPKRQLHINGGNETVKIQLTNTTTGSGTDGDGFQISIASNGDAYLEQRENSPLIFTTNNTERCRILAAGGLTFNGDTAAANALDDYEEGTWTPTVTSGASSLTVTTASCMYTKVGKLVTLQFEIRDPTSVTSDAFKLGGLPFNFDDQTVGSVMVHSVNFDTGRTMVTLYGFSSELRFYGSGDSVAWEILHGDDITTSGTIIGTISYRVA